MTIKITEDEWRAELEKLGQSQNQQDGMTIREIAEMLGYGVEKTRRMVEKLLLAKKLIALTVMRTSPLNNVTRPRPGFKLIKESQKK